jgi:hypothetical protein
MEGVTDGRTTLHGEVSTVVLFIKYCQVYKSKEEDRAKKMKNAYKNICRKFQRGVNWKRLDEQTIEISK